MDEKISEEPQADQVPWTIGDVAKGIGVVIGITILIAFFILIGTSLLIGVDAFVDIASLDTSELFSELLALLESEGLLQPWLIMVLAGMVVGEGAMPAAAWLFSSRKYRCGWRALGFRSFNIKRALIMVAVVLIAGILINLLYEWVMSYFGVESSDLTVELTQTPLGLAGIAAVAVLVAPIAEETLFRGFILGGIGKRFGYGWGAVVSALIFSLAHMQPGALLPIFILGLLLAWLYIKTGSIWPCILTHFAYNSIAILFMII